MAVITIEYSGLLAEVSIKRANTTIARAQRTVQEDAARYYHDREFPGRFRFAEPYHFAPRTAAYNKRKKRLYGHTRPLEFTGDLRKSTVRERRVTSRKSQASGLITTKIILPGARKVNRFRDGGQIREDLFKWLPSQEKTLAARMIRNLMKILKGINFKTRKTIRK